MKKVNFLVICIVIEACYCLSSCKKAGSPTHTDNRTLYTEISYQFNGKTYDDGSSGTHSFTYYGTDLTGITIDRTDLFGGKIIFY